ncbi:MAG: hypothetical protein RIQ89_2048 [Bacteroidota bacterium]|jgi:hypothetical protein
MLIRISKFLFFILYLCFFVDAQETGSVGFDDRPFQLSLQKSSFILDKLKETEAYKIALPEEKECMYWVNYARLFPKNFIDSVVIPFLEHQPQLKGSYANSLLSDLEKQAELPFLIPETRLLESARSHATDLAKRSDEKLSHNSSNGNRFSDRMRTIGIKFCYAENIAESPQNTLIAVLLLYLDINVSNLGHRLNLFNPNYTIMGVGVSRRPNQQFVVVQDFACAQ